MAASFSSCAARALSAAEAGTCTAVGISVQEFAAKALERRHRQVSETFLQLSDLKCYLLYLVQAGDVRAAVIELGCPRALIGGHLLGLHQVPAIGE
jgi:hypothetical protein